MPTIYFLTHPEVVIDPAVPITRWPLSDVGRRRMGRFIEMLDGRGLAAVLSSDEQKALDGAEMIAAAQGVPHLIDPELGENDRESTGFLAPPEFWEVVEQFFSRPDESIRGWERARDAQARIVRAVERAVREAPAGDLAIVSHGGVGRLLAAHLDGVEIGQEARPEHPGGGCWLEVDRGQLTISRSWNSIADA
ncbi:phosphoglycerate mutase family protein [Phenylobacterium sp. LjRoot164]|uniref:histidine phosphatase family protein n=1 Tax=unclassified Phenylobacterium TaxID=2640670 RepID=UPI003ECFF9BA